VYDADRTLVARMCAGEQRAFDEFFNASASRLAAFATRRSGLDSASLEDVVQNTMIKAVRGLASYRGEAALFTWLTEICRRELADAHRKAARRPGHDSLEAALETPDTLLQLRVPEQREPTAEVEAELCRRAIIRILNGLPERYALALEAEFGDGLSVDDSAQSLGLTPTAAQSLLARARDAFRERWRAESNDDTQERG
jgi:RNA polymerase sigma-70 factor (ECF subfamily)